MKKFLVVVDIQKDFVDGALGTKEAVSMIPAAAEKIRGFEGDIFVMFDTHFEDYLETAEGRKLPVTHCIKGSEGWQLDKHIAAALEGKRYTAVEKLGFGSTELPAMIAKAAGGDKISIEIIGLCTDICVISDALILRAYFREADISLHAACCAGVTPENHEAALKVMQSCQIDIV